MKLYNKTKYPDDLLESLLIEAGKAVNARTAKVIVIATSGKAGYPSCHGVATRCDYVKRFALDTRAYKKGTYELKKGLVETDRGYFKITLPYPFLPDWVKASESYKQGRLLHDGLSITESIFSVASHEWRHIKQYQDNMFRDRFFVKQERRKRHDNRAWEKDAIKAANKAQDKPKNKAQEAILNLSLWIEENK